MPIHLDRSHLLPFLDERDALDDRLATAHRRVLDDNTPDSEMLGWRRMLLKPDDAVLEDLAATAAEIRERADVLVCIGIGGSYLGAKAVTEALTPWFDDNGPEILFAGHHLSPSYHEALLHYLEGKSVYVNVISKSGSTLEPALAFRFVRQFVEDTFDDAQDRILVTTGPEGGLLNPLRNEKGYRKYVIPDGVGGRFSVLTPVGLLPIAVAGIDIRSLFYGAVSVARAFTGATPDHPVLQYAGDRYALHEAGKVVELLSVMEPKLHAVGSWWQQLFGESEGKESKGLFPVVAQYTTDLHSLGQYVQEGQRTLAETFLRVDDAGTGLTPSALDSNPDGLNYLAATPYGTINEKAYQATAAAHAEGGVPNATIRLSRLDAEVVGELIAWFEHAVTIGGLLLGVNPFNQPGVEAYKSKMFSLLGRETP